jgi:hypothetical protein
VRFTARLRAQDVFTAANILFFQSGARMHVYRPLHVEDEPDIREVVEMSLALHP